MLDIGITYIYHSGFAVETNESCLVFDYYAGSVNLRDKSTYVFCSHNHADHYNAKIFTWLDKVADIQYILSSDIISDKHLPAQKDKIVFIEPYEEKIIKNIYIKTFGSTDEGISFLVQCDGINIFHAGDLNWWHWDDDIPEAIKEAEQGFREEIAIIKEEHIDIAFFPVDPRLGQNYYIGAELFINEIKPRFFIPMHFWDNYEIIGKLKEKMKASPTQIIEISCRGQEIKL